MSYDSKKAEFNREHIYVVEVDRPYCLNTFATSPCLGGIWETATTSSSGVFKVGDTIYEGVDLDSATTVATVVSVTGSNPTVTLQYTIDSGVQFTSTGTIDNDDDTGTATQSGTITNESTGDQKCYNTLGTCQDFQNFDNTVTTGAVSISVNSSLQFARSTGSFITDGFEVDMYLTASGFTNAGNNNRFRVSAVAALTITLESTTGMVVESAGTRTLNGEKFLVYRFCEPRSPHPIGLDAIPNIKGVKIAPAKIDVKGGLGVRAQANVTFDDHPHSDIGIDPYLSDRSYDPLQVGLFWTKYRARNEDYQYDEMRVFSAYLEGDNYDESNAELRYYLVDSLSVTNGGASMVGKDTLRLAMKDKAVAPAVSTGSLSADMTDVQTTIVLNTGDGAEYPSSGKVLIDKEIIDYVSKSTDTLNVNTSPNGRGNQNTVAAAHKADATVQLVLEYDGETLDFIVDDLLTNYAEINSNFIPTGSWSTEVDTYLSNTLNAIIPKPTDVNKLLKELSESAPHYLWWDERSQQVQLTALKPPPETANIIDEDGQILEDSYVTKDMNDMRYSTIIVNYGQFDPTEKIDEIRNYQASYIRVDANSIQKYKKNQIKTINSRWILRTANATAQKLAQTYGRRFAEIPRECRFSLDPKDSAGGTGIWAGDSRSIQHSDTVDFNGNPTSSIYQITSVREGEDKFDFMAFEYRYGDLIAGELEELTDTVIYSGDIQNVVLYDDFENEWGTPTASTTATFIVKAGVVIGSSSTSTYAMRTEDATSFPAGATVILIIEAGAYIVGKGGNGATGGSGNGTAGGDALEVTRDITIKNSGTIGGGGGGGGGASETFAGDAGGGGGAGDDGGTGAASVADPPDGFVQRLSGNGQVDDGGQGGVCTNGALALAAGGGGGDLAQDGNDGVAITGTEGTGGAGGTSVTVTAGTITYDPQGDVRT